MNVVDDDVDALVDGEVQLPPLCHGCARSSGCLNVVVVVDLCCCSCWTRTKLNWRTNGDCRPDEVGLFGVSSSSGRIHLVLRPGDSGLSTLSGSDSTVLLGTV